MQFAYQVRTHALLKSVCSVLGEIQLSITCSIILGIHLIDQKALNQASETGFISQGFVDAKMSLGYIAIVTFIIQNVIQLVYTIIILVPMLARLIKYLCMDKLLEIFNEHFYYEYWVPAKFYLMKKFPFLFSIMRKFKNEKADV